MITETHKSKIFVLVMVLIFGYMGACVSAQTGQGLLPTPSIGITSVPNPPVLPDGPGDVTYKYAVKNFVKEAPLSNVTLTDNKCSPVEFVEGDDDDDDKLDFEETWRYECTTKVYATNQSVAVATGVSGDATATHRSYSTVVVGSYAPPPIVSIVDVTKVAYPYSLPAEGGDVVFIYRVSNPGFVPLSNVIVTDDICDDISGKVGDTNNDNELDLNEVWTYTCTTHLTKTTTNTVYVSSTANDLYAIGDSTVTVHVATSPDDDYAADFENRQSLPTSFPETGDESPRGVVLWGALLGASLALIITYVILKRKNK